MSKKTAKYLAAELQEAIATSTHDCSLMGVLRSAHAFISELADAETGSQDSDALSRLEAKVGLLVKQSELVTLRLCLTSGNGEASVPKEIARRLGVSFLTEVRAIPYEDGEVKIVHGGDNFRMETWFTKDALIGIIEQYEKDTER